MDVKPEADADIKDNENIQGESSRSEQKRYPV